MPISSQMASIFHRRDVLLRGCRWRIGNGKSMSIWQDLWLPSKNSPQVLSLIIDTISSAKVEILIDEKEKQWNHGASM